MGLIDTEERQLFLKRFCVWEKECSLAVANRSTGRY